MLKWAGIVVGGLVGLILLAAVVLYITGKVRVARRYDPPPALAQIPADSAAVDRGRRVVLSRSCAVCHGDRLEGKVFLDIPPAFVVGSNLTPGRGGVGREYALADWDRAVRYGVRPDGSSLISFMPYKLFNQLDDADAAAVAAYLESLAPIDNELPKSRLKTLGYVIMGIVGTGHSKLRRDRRVVPVGVTAEYGRYVSSTTCVECHGERLAGGKHPDPSGPPGPSLIGYASLPADSLVSTLRTGVTPGGRRLTKYMPWENLRHLTDTEIAAVHAYLRQLASQPAPTT